MRRPENLGFISYTHQLFKNERSAKISSIPKRPRALMRSNCRLMAMSCLSGLCLPARSGEPPSNLWEFAHRDPVGLRPGSAAPP